MRPSHWIPAFAGMTGALRIAPEKAPALTRATVIPAKAGIQQQRQMRPSHWIPAFAGMTGVLRIATEKAPTLTRSTVIPAKAGIQQQP